MRLKRFLLIAPFILILGLAQSYFWVPTYEAHTTGNPERVWKYIEASIGDAKILNPILHSDTASGRITGLVFEGLLDLDENLELRGRLATDWKITERAYVLADARARLPDGAPATPERLKRRIEAAIAAGRLPALKALVTAIRIEPAMRYTKTIRLPGAGGKAVETAVRIDRPARLRFDLKRVDQDFFDRLRPVLGGNYARTFPIADRIEVLSETARGKLRSRFAELLPVFEHNPVILFRLRRGVRFHDGHEFDAGDVKFTYEAIMDPKNLSPRTSDFEPIKAVEILDRYTVQIVYKRLFSPAINAWTMGVLPEHLLNDAAMQREMARRNLSAAARARFGMRDSEFNRRPIGTGPFRFVEWQSDELVRLVRNDDYWEGPPQYKEFVYRVIPDPLTQEVAFRTGAIDSYAPQPHQAARYKKDPAYQAFSSLGMGYTYIGYNHRRPLFSDARVRRALGMAINVDEIIRYVLYGQAERTTGPYPKNTQWYDHAVAPLPYDPEGALKILEGLGWRRNAEGWLEKDGRIFEFNLITNHGNLIRKAIMTIAQNSWRKLGIKANTQVFEWAVFLEDFINKAQFDAVILGWSMGPDPDLYQIWHSSQAGPAQLNFIGYNNAEADRLIVRIRREYDTTVQRELAHRLHRLISEDQPYTFLYASIGTLALDRKIVMVEDDGRYAPLRPTKSGNLFFYFNRWRKLAYTPQF